MHRFVRMLFKPGRSYDDMMMNPSIDIVHLDFRVDVSRYRRLNSRFIVTRPFRALYWVIVLDASCDPAASLERPMLHCRQGEPSQDSPAFPISLSLEAIQTRNGHDCINAAPPATSDL
jgi:hypothetical protein